MTTTVVLPKMGDTADAVVIVEWLAAPGDRLAAGQPLVRVETAKAEVEIPTPVGGTLARTLAAVDEEIVVGAPLAEIEG